MKAKNIAGLKSGKLTAIKIIGKTKDRHALWLCICDCGEYTTCPSNDFQKNTHPHMCKKCLSKLYSEIYKKTRKTHGKSRDGKKHTRLFRIWQDMKGRCYYPSSKNYKWYGKRGITICEEWINNFESFYNWAINNGYSDELSIDRIDCDGNYCPENCRWATAKEQANNKRNNKKVAV